MGFSGTFIVVRSDQPVAGLSALAALDWHVQHLAGDLVLHARQGDAIQVRSDCPGEQAGEGEFTEVIDSGWLVSASI